MKKKWISLLTTVSLLFSNTALRAEETASSAKVGTAAKQGTSTATVAWAVVGVAFLVAIGVAVAVTISND